MSRTEDCVDEETGKSSEILGSRALLRTECQDLLRVSQSHEMLPSATSSVTSLVGMPMPESTYGQVNMRESSHTHLGHKIVANNITIVNQNVSNRKKTKSVKQPQPTDAKQCSLCPRKIELLPPLFLIVVLFLFSIVMLTNRESSKSALRIDMKVWSNRKHLPIRCRRNDDNIQLITVDHTGDKTCKDMLTCRESMKRVEDLGFSRNASDDYSPYYNFLVGGDGIIYEWFGWNCSVHHSQFPYSQYDIRVAFLGDYNRNNLTDGQKKAFNAIVEQGFDSKRLSPVYRLVPQCCAYGRYSNGPGSNALDYINSLAENKVKTCVHKNTQTCSPNYRSNLANQKNTTGFG